MFKLTQHFGVDLIDRFEFSSPSVAIGTLPPDKEAFVKYSRNKGNTVRAVYTSFEHFKTETEKVWGNLAIYFKNYFSPLEKWFDSTKNELHFVIYTGPEDFLKLVLSLWKTAFTNASKEDLWDLYSMYKKFSESSTGWIEIPNSKELPLYSQSKEQFDAAYESAELIKCSREEILAIMPVEFLLCSYFYDRTNEAIRKHLHENLKFDFHYLFFVECRDVFNHAKENLCNWYPFFYKGEIDRPLEDYITLSSFPDEVKEILGEKNLKLVLDYPFGYSVKYREFYLELDKALDVQAFAAFLIDWAERRRQVTVQKAWKEDMTSRTSYPTDHLAKYGTLDNFEEMIDGAQYNTEYWEELSWKRHNFYPQLVRIIENKDNEEYLKKFLLVDK